MPEIIALPVTAWQPTLDPALQVSALRELESGNVLLLPQLPFELDGAELPLFDALPGDAKNISWNATRGVRGVGPSGDPAMLQALLARYAGHTRSVLDALVPSYGNSLQQGNTSFRPVEIRDRTTSWRKDDTLLHVDSFPASPTRGRRILRVFTNIHPHKTVRMWKLGSSFEELTTRYASSVPALANASSPLLHWLGITKARRSLYDWCMLHIHDRMKADARYQQQAAQAPHAFAPGQTWIAFTDQVTHAALSGQHALEQTYLLPVDAMATPALSPLAVLERQIGRPLA